MIRHDNIPYKLAKSAIDILKEHVQQSETKVQQIQVLYKEIEDLCNQASKLTKGKIILRLESADKLPKNNIQYLDSDKAYKGVSDFIKISRPLFRFGRFRVKFVYSHKSYYNCPGYGDYSYYNYERLTNDSLNYIIDCLNMTKLNIEKIIKEF